MASGVLVRLRAVTRVRVWVVAARGFRDGRRTVIEDRTVLDLVYRLRKPFLVVAVLFRYRNGDVGQSVTRFGAVLITFDQNLILELISDLVPCSD